MLEPHSFKVFNHTYNAVRELYCCGALGSNAPQHLSQYLQPIQNRTFQMPELASELRTVVSSAVFVTGQNQKARFCCGALDSKAPQSLFPLVYNPSKIECSGRRNLQPRANIGFPRPERSITNSVPEYSYFQLGIHFDSHHNLLPICDRDVTSV